LCRCRSDRLEEKEAELRAYQSHLEDMVSERARELLVAKDAAEAANRAKSAFLANMSHELRTPMNGVMGMMELAKRHMIDPKGRVYLDKAKGAADNLLAVLNDILDLSKIEADRLALEELPLHLSGRLRQPDRNHGTSGER
jgi:Signal transduction histidine kinase